MRVPPIVKRIYDEFSEDRIPAVAGGITFFFLLALFPAIASIVSLYGLFADKASIADQLRLVSGFLPGGAVTVLRAEVHRLILQKPAALDLAFVISFVIALWSASGGVKALLDGLNIAFETKETRSFVRITLNALFFTLASIVLAAIAIKLTIVLPAFVAHLPLGHVLEVAFQILVWPLSFCLCSVILSIIYRYGPDRPRKPWRWITWGSAIASALWMLGTLLFTWYVQNYGSYNRTYGELGAAVGFLTWVWLSLVILLLGAEIVFEFERREKTEKEAGLPHAQAPHR